MDDQSGLLKPPDDLDKRWRGRTLVLRAGGNGSRRMLPAALAVGACAIVAGVSVAVFSSPAGQTGRLAGQSGSPAPAAGAAQRTAPAVRAGQPAVPGVSGRGATGPGNTSDGIARTALRWPRELKPQITRWNAGPGGAALSAVTVHLGSAMQAAAVRLYPVVRSRCVSLSSSVEAARGAPPIPDAAMQRLYAEVLAGLSGATVDCRNAISIHTQDVENIRIDLNKALLNRSLAQFAAESNLLYTATAELRTLPR